VSATDRHSPDLGESRWPPALALLAFLSLNLALRLWLGGDAEPVRVPFLVPALEAVLLVLLVIGPAGAAARGPWLRRIALGVVAVLVLAALWETVLLVHDLIKGVGAIVSSPTRLLATGAVVWLGNILAFALLYWLVDGDGPRTRARRPEPVDFAFTQHMSPELAPPGWRPVFLHYLHLGFTNATAFSPTDVMPLVPWAKIAMTVQSVISLAILGLVVARAVNVLR
jgi:hypothetical protein